MHSTIGITLSGHRVPKHLCVPKHSCDIYVFVHDPVHCSKSTCTVYNNVYTADGIPILRYVYKKYWFTFSYKSNRLTVQNMSVHHKILQYRHDLHAQILFLVENMSFS